MRGPVRTRKGKPGADGLAALLAEVRACRVCRDCPRGPPLPHEPRPIVRGLVSARIAICGQAPGIRVHRSGLPFDDASGDRLRKWMGIDRATFYDETQIAVVPMGFCFPGYDAKGSDLPPRVECAPLWRSRVLAGFTNVSLVLLVGSYALRWHLPEVRQAGMTQTVQSWRRIVSETERTGPVLFPLPHPSWRNTGWLKAHPWFGEETVPEVQARVASLLR